MNLYQVIPPHTGQTGKRSWVSGITMLLESLHSAQQKYPFGTLSPVRQSLIASPPSRVHCITAKESKQHSPIKSAARTVAPVQTARDTKDSISPWEAKVNGGTHNDENSVWRDG